ncbi:uncharacterized protein PADG_11626 [Paracoccidioides brasiliensis Pb18]|uniref:Uncharacterized protein n=1 Tax=Paracoccidioides brasiliensis (strain Pb18) TaxID=502780 RepID=A0A0A0HVM7_PARBD|nr:uncharacterized protein PADG_11626 [Paracoccidioides brasiliensis Pb18]KGM92096.1 hypothetical protein PADG_11626 [Paracoccidioides brasiliensis Pb18]
MGVMPSVKYDDTSTSSYFRKNSFDRGTRSTQSHIPKALCQELPNTVPFVKDAPPRRVNCLGAYCRHVFRNRNHANETRSPPRKWI